MPSKSFPSDAVEQAKDVANGWKTFDAAFQVSTMTLKAFETELTNAVSQQNQIDALEKQLTDLRNQRDASNTTLWESVKRVRNTVKGIYGDNSSQYELVGGTRMSERKPAVRKVKPEA